MMHALDVPTLDMGFSLELRWWSDELTGFQQSDLPFCLVTLEMGKLLVTAQRQREQALEVLCGLFGKAFVGFTA